MTEEEARELWIKVNSDVLHATREECKNIDAWVRNYALNNLQNAMTKYTGAVRTYVMVCARAHYGSVETDTLLQAFNCYPAWMK